MTEEIKPIVAEIVKSPETSPRDLPTMGLVGGGATHLKAYRFSKTNPPGRPFKKGQSGNPLGKPRGWINKTAKLKHEMLDVMGRNRNLRMRVLKEALEKDGLRYLAILASLLPKEQVVDLSVRGGLSVLAAQMSNEELLRIALAVGLEIEPNGEAINGEARGPEAEQNPEETGDKSLT